MTGQIEYPGPEVTRLTGHRRAMGMGIVLWPATDHDPEHFSIGWSHMTRDQVRAFGRQLLDIAGEPEPVLESAAEPDVPVDRNESGRESTISGEFATATLHGYQEAARLVHGGLRDVVWVTQDGMAVAAIIPAQDYHPPGTCCCKNCPWGGNHGTA